MAESVMCKSCGKWCEATISLTRPGKGPTPPVCMECAKRAMDIVRGHKKRENPEPPLEDPLKTTTDLLLELESTSADVHGRVKNAQALFERGNWLVARSLLEVIKQRHKTCVALCDAALRDVKEELVDEKANGRADTRTPDLPFPDGVDEVTLSAGGKEVTIGRGRKGKGKS